MFQRIVSDLIVRTSPIAGSPVGAPPVSYVKQVVSEVTPPGHMTAAEVASQVADVALMVHMWSAVTGWKQSVCVDVLSVHRTDIHRALTALLSSSSSDSDSQVLTAQQQQLLQSDADTRAYRDRLLARLSSQSKYVLPVPMISLPRSALAQAPDILNRPADMPDSSVAGASSTSTSSSKSAEGKASSGSDEPKLPLYQLMLQPLSRFGFPLATVTDTSRQLTQLVGAERGVSAALARHCILNILSASRSVSASGSSAAATADSMMAFGSGSSGNAFSPRLSLNLSSPTAGASNIATTRVSTSGAAESKSPGKLSSSPTVSKSGNFLLAPGAAAPSASVSSEDEKRAAALSSPRRSGLTAVSGVVGPPPALTQLLLMLQQHTASLQQQQHMPQLQLPPTSFTLPHSTSKPTSHDSNSKLLSAAVFSFSSTSSSASTTSATAAGAPFLARFLRVLFAARSRADLAQLEDAFRSTLCAEFVHTTLQPYGPVRRLVAQELVAELALQLTVSVLPAVSSSGFRSTQVPSMELIVWLVELFLSVLQSQALWKAGGAACHAQAVQLLFGSGVADLLLARVLVSLDESVFPLMLLLGRVVALRGVKLRPQLTAMFHEALASAQRVSSCPSSLLVLCRV